MPTDPPPTDPWDIMLRVINEDATTARLRANLECLRVAIETERAAERQQATAQQEIACPLCGEIVKQVASATLGLALWQHVNWTCEARKKAEAEVVRLTAENERLRGALDTQLRITTEHWQVIETQRQELERLQRPWRSRVEHAEGVAFLVADAVDPRDAEISALRWQIGDCTREVDELAAEVASLTERIAEARRRIAAFESAR